MAIPGVTIIRSEYPTDDSQTLVDIYLQPLNRRLAFTNAFNTTSLVRMDTYKLLHIDCGI